MTNGDYIRVGDITGENITIGKDIIQVSGNVILYINDHPPLQKTISNLSQDNVIEAANNFIDALETSPDIARRFNEALQKHNAAKKSQQALVEANREQESTNEVKIDPFADPLSSALRGIDPFADPIDPLSSSNTDIELLLLRMTSGMEGRLKREMVILANKIDFNDETSQITILSLQQILNTLQKLFETKNKILEGRADANQSIIRNL